MNKKNGKILIYISITISMVLFVYYATKNSDTNRATEIANTEHIKNKVNTINIKDSSTNLSEDTKKEDYKNETDEFYEYSMLKKCQSFLRQKVRTFEDFSEMMFNIADLDVDLQTEFNKKFEICQPFLKSVKDFNDIQLQSDELEKLLNKAVEKRIPGALAEKAFRDVFFGKKNIIEVQPLWVESLAANIPESLMKLSLLVDAFSSRNDKLSIGASLVVAACEAGHSDCGFDSFYVTQTCQISGVCGGNLRETIQMSVPGDLINEFENTLVNIRNTHTKEEWERLFDEVFTTDELENTWQQ